MTLWQGARGIRSARNFLALWQGARESRSARNFLALWQGVRGRRSACNFWPFDTGWEKVEVPVIRSLLAWGTRGIGYREQVRMAARVSIPMVYCRVELMAARVSIPVVYREVVHMAARVSIPVVYREVVHMAAQGSASLWSTVKWFAQQ